MPEAMRRYGSGQTRFAFRDGTADLSGIKDTAFAPFASVLETRRNKMLVVKGKADYSRKQLTTCRSSSNRYGASALAWINRRSGNDFIAFESFGQGKLRNWLRRRTPKKAIWF
jgi:aspartyl-tRNA synthetase